MRLLRQPASTRTFLLPFLAPTFSRHARGQVEIWCWQKSLSRFLRALGDNPKHARQLSLHFLDDYRDRLCFKPRVRAPAAAAAAAAAAVAVVEDEVEDDECVVCMDAGMAVLTIDVGRISHQGNSSNRPVWLWSSCLLCTLCSQVA